LIRVWGGRYFPVKRDTLPVRPRMQMSSEARKRPGTGAMAERETDPGL
jgi:hypothetical protein